MILAPNVTMSISEEDFQKFREFFYRKTGIRFEDTKRYFVDKRLIDRMQATGFADFRSYFNFMRFQANGEEMQQLINIMTVNETYFFREEHQLKCLALSILPEVVKKKPAGSLIRIWSIPSSSGEEPYSIAIYLLEYCPLVQEWDIEIIGSDIDTGMLQKAKEGIYSPRSVQHIPPSLLKKYFRKLSEDRYQISEELRRCIEFTRVNLNDSTDTKQYRNFDVIFCRNLLIYFDDLSRRQAADVFYDALLPGGYILLGHSESMSRISPLFKVCKFPEAIVYKKPEGMTP